MTAICDRPGRTGAPWAHLSRDGCLVQPDGERLVTAAPDGAVRVWTLVLDDLIAIAEEELTRGFTDDESRQYLHLRSCSA